jgi:hypothetical protein
MGKAFTGFFSIWKNTVIYTKYSSISEWICCPGAIDRGQLSGRQLSGGQLSGGNCPGGNCPGAIVWGELS